MNYQKSAIVPRLLGKAVTGGNRLSLSTMQFGRVRQGNIYAVGLRRVLAKAKVYAVRH